MAKKRPYQHYRRRPKQHRPAHRPVRRPAPIKPGAEKCLKSVFAQIGVPDARPFQADAFQLEALEAIERSDCLVTAPTGSGKTWIAQEAIAARVQADQRAWYACPLKALSNAKYQEFCDHFGPQQVGILTGDRRENPEAPILVGTTEILRNQLYDAMHMGQSLSVDLVVLDEAHFMGDPERGVVWEEIMIYLPPRIPLLLLSATIGNAAQIAAWLSATRRQPCRVIAETRRPVPLFALFLHPSGTLMPLQKQTRGNKRTGLYKKVATFAFSRHQPRLGPPGKLPPVADVVEVMRRHRLLPAIFFMKSRADCDQALQIYAQSAPQLPSARKERLDYHIEQLTLQSELLSEHRQVGYLKEFAIGAHHGGQLPAWKLTLENLMTRGLLDVVFATSTVAAGVNFPARTIVLLNSDRFNGTEFVPLDATELHQMTGRAGRRGKDKIGFALMLPGKYMDLRMVANLFQQSPANVNSQIQVSFSMVLNLLLSHTPDQVEGLYQHAFAAWQVRRRQAETADGVRSLVRDLRRHQAFLQAHGYLDSRGRPTTVGFWAARLRVDQPLLIAEGLRRGCFPSREPTLLAAVIAALIYDRDTGRRRAQPRLAKPLEAALFKMVKPLAPFVKIMRQAKFFVRSFNEEPAAAVYAWLTGMAWPEVCAGYEVADGDLASLILRTADNLRHIHALARPFPDVAACANRAVVLLLQPPVTDEPDFGQ